MSMFKRATRQQVPLKLGITGPSGSGKTTAALRLTRGLIGPDAPIAFVDTENGSASLYAHLTTFDVVNMNPPYQVAKFVQSIQGAVEGGYKALIIDSGSAEWQELLSEKEAMDARGGNSFANWGAITKKHEEFLKAVRNAPIHIILCLRAKQEHVQDKDANGKTTIRKVGLAAVQREGAEYELTTVFDIAMDHNAKASKDRTGLFEGRLEPVTEATGREIAAWLETGATMTPEAPEVAQVGPTPAPVSDPAQGTPTVTSTPAPEPQTVGEVFAQMPPPDPTPVGPEAAAFVDDIADGPEKAITKKQYEQLDAAINLWPVLTHNRNSLRAFCQAQGYLLPAKVPTLARLKAEKFEALMTNLGDDDKRRALVAHLAAHYPNTVPNPAALPAAS